MNSLLDFMEERQPTGRDLAEEGMARAEDHAERVEPKWGAQAYDRFTAYCANGGYVTVEAIKAWAYDTGLPKPPAEGAWGAVTRRAVRDGVIVFHEFTESQNASQHMKPVRVWRVVK